ncbi:HECT-domain (ubiquitin-transferase), putative [Plasmodium ovale curtisi]|uniref:HECT-domain (Ubiquitin-transferase), putative n=1 Tax=Plasmodium ovale curtisi TaxID=864141 RepID=A0A1A8WM28_PLAOA|nr:HECT-domain (ubiquitin-transferase), putative [Plasmodium ovale curtisi]
MKKGEIIERRSKRNKKKVIKIINNSKANKHAKHIIKDEDDSNISYKDSTSLNNTEEASLDFVNDKTIIEGNYYGIEETKQDNVLWNNNDGIKNQNIKGNFNIKSYLHKKNKNKLNNKINNICQLFNLGLKHKEEILNIFSIIYLFRMCVYYLSRNKDFRKEDYWQKFQGQLRNAKIKENVYKLINEKSYKYSILYGWQRIFYKSVVTWKDKKLVNQLLLIIQCELLYHLIGSIVQCISQKRVKVENFHAISPSVHVAHWLLDTFIRHPLCPSQIRSSCITPISVTSLFGLIVNGNRLPIILGIDVCRLVYWSCVTYIMQNRTTQKNYKQLLNIDMLTQFNLPTENFDNIISDTIYNKLDTNHVINKTTQTSRESQITYNNIKNKYQRIKCNYNEFLNYLFNCVNIFGSSVFNQIIKLNEENGYKINNSSKNKYDEINNNSNSGNARNNNDNVNNIIDNLNNNINDILNCIQNSSNNRILNNNFSG